MIPIDFSFYGTPKVSESIAAALRLPGFLGIPWPGSGSVGCIRTDRDGRTTMSETLRFNIVIFVAFTERETHICVVHVPNAWNPWRWIHELVPHSWFRSSLACESAPFLCSFSPETYNAFRWRNMFGRNFWWSQFGRSANVKWNYN